MNTAQLWTDTLYLLPEIIIALTGLLALVWDFISPESVKKSRLALFSLFGIMLAAVFCFMQAGLDKQIFSNLLAVDYFAVVYKIILLVTAGMVILMSMNYLKVQDTQRGEYYVLILFSTLGMMVMAAATNFISMYLGLELTAISCYILCGFMIKDKASNESAIKYFILGLFASAILVYGISLIYGVCGSLNFSQIQQALSRPGGNSGVVLLTGMVMLIVGFGFKMAVVPFHMWMPDVYEGAPTPVTAFMSIGPKVACFAVALRFFPIAAYALRVQWGFIFAILAAITITLANFHALRQESVKRMLAYSGISHVGYALIGLVATTVDRQIGLMSVIVYFLVYFTANVGAFGVIVLLCQKGRMGEKFDDFKGLGKRSPFAAMLMTIFMLSLLGIPPTGGFLAKVWVFAAAVKADYMWLAVIGVINAIISAYYYLRVTVMMYMHDPEEQSSLSFTPALAVALYIMAFFTLYMGVFPGSFFELAKKSVIALL